jgi:hypothetical protein
VNRVAEAAKKLTPRQQRVLEVLLVGGTDAQAAEAAKLHKNSVYALRSQNPACMEPMRLAQTDLIKRTTSRLHAATSIAVKALEEVAKDVRNPSVRVAAARRSLSSAMRGSSWDLEQRLPHA